MDPEKKPVCLVDDEREALVSMELTLRVAGIAPIATFTSWNDAAPLIENNGARLVVLDILMPGASGIDALRLIRKKNRSVPVIMATCIDNVENAVKCMQYGANDYLVKPLKNGHFVECVRNALVIDELSREEPVLDKGKSGPVESAPAEEPAPTATKSLEALSAWVQGFTGALMREVGPEQEPLLRSCLDLLWRQKAYLEPDLTIADVAHRCATNTTIFRAASTPRSASISHVS